MIELYANIAYFGLWGCMLIYQFCGIYLSLDKLYKKPHPPTLNGWWRWTKWPALCFGLLSIPLQILMHEDIGMWDHLGSLLNLAIWWMYRNAGDDDPMDKLRKKFKEKVAEIGGKLVIVPSGA